jgi:hypothetical protein
MHVMFVGLRSGGPHAPGTGRRSASPFYLPLRATEAQESMADRRSVARSTMRQHPRLLRKRARYPQCGSPSTSVRALPRRLGTHGVQGVGDEVEPGSWLDLLSGHLLG